MVNANYLSTVRVCCFDRQILKSTAFTTIFIISLFIHATSKKRNLFPCIWLHYNIANFTVKMEPPLALWNIGTLPQHYTGSQLKRPRL